MRFTDDEWMLMMLYSPGTRTGLIEELQTMQKSLTGRDRNLRRWTASLLAKLAEMTDPDREKTTEKPSVLAELRDRAGRIPPVTHRDDEEVAL